MKLNRVLFLLPLVAVAAISACTKDRAKDDDNENGPNVKVVDYQKRQKAYADSVLNTASTAKSVASKLGKGYDVGSLRLRDTLELLVHGDKNACYNAGHDADPYLAGVVNFFVHMNVVGSDVVNIQDSKWTGPAGNLVDACLNKAAQNWKFDATFGKAAAYIIQLKFEAVIPKPRTLAEDSAAKKDSAAKAATAKKKPKN